MLNPVPLPRWWWWIRRECSRGPLSSALSPSPLTTRDWIRYRTVPTYCVPRTQVLIRNLSNYPYLGTYVYGLPAHRLLSIKILNLQYYLFFFLLICMLLCYGSFCSYFVLFREWVTGFFWSTPMTIPTKPGERCRIQPIILFIAYIAQTIHSIFTVVLMYCSCFWVILQVFRKILVFRLKIFFAVLKIF